MERRVEHLVGRLVGYSVLSVIWLPILAAVSVTKLFVVRPLLSADALSCPTCGSDVSLLGLWECGVCGFSFYGFYFSRCGLCGEAPAYRDCSRCGASLLNPLVAA